MKTPLAQFLQIEQELGITPANFSRKFIFGGGDCQAYLLHRDEPTPSALDGIPIETERHLTRLLSEMILRASESLQVFPSQIQVPVSTAIVGILIAQFYFVRHSFLRTDLRDVCMGACLLACKVEQTPRKAYSIALVFDYVFKQYERTGNKVLVYNSNEYKYTVSYMRYMLEQVVESERDILFAIGFEYYKLLDIPHRYIGIFLKTFSRHRESKSIAQTAWELLNDCYHTSVCLYYPGQVIAAAAIYMALARLKIPMPQCPWWVLLEASYEQIETIVAEVQAVKGMRLPSLSDLSDVLSAVARVQLNVVNVFPPSYYRKIQLHQGRMLRLTSRIEPTVNSRIQPTVNIAPRNSRSNSSKSSSQSSIYSSKEKSSHLHKPSKQPGKHNQTNEETLKKQKIDKKELLESMSLKLKKYQEKNKNLLEQSNKNAERTANLLKEKEQAQTVLMKQARAAQKQENKVEEKIVQEKELSEEQLIAQLVRIKRQKISKK